MGFGPRQVAHTRRLEPARRPRGKPTQCYDRRTNDSSLWRLPFLGRETAIRPCTSVSLVRGRACRSLWVSDCCRTGRAGQGGDGQAGRKDKENGDTSVSDRRVTVHESFDLRPLPEPGDSYSMPPCIRQRSVCIGTKLYCFAHDRVWGLCPATKLLGRTSARAWRADDAHTMVVTSRARRRSRSSASRREREHENERQRPRARLVQKPFGGDHVTSLGQTGGDVVE